MGLFQKLFRKENRNYINDISDFGYGTGFNIFGAKNSHALALSAVFAATELISNSIAQLPIRVKHKSHDKDECIPSHPLSFVFKRGTISKFALIKSMVSDMLLYGNGFAYIKRATDGTITSLQYLSSKDVSIHYDPMTDELYYLSSLVGGRILPNDIIHIYKNSYNGIEGKGIMSYAQRTIDLCNYTENSTLDYWQKGLHKFGVLHAKSPMTPAQAKDSQKLIEGDITNNTNTYIKWLPFDLTFEPMSNNATDSQMIESRTFNISEIARYFNINPVLLGDLSHSSYSTIESAQLEFILHTLSPYIALIEEELNRKLLKYGDVDLFIELDSSAIMKADMSATSSYIQTLINCGVLCTNEAREILGYAPIEGGNKHTIAYTDLKQNILSE